MEINGMRSVQFKDFWFPEVKDGGGERHYTFSTKRVASLNWVLDHWKDRRKIVVQAGGSYGVWPKKLASEFEYVYTFEPDAVSFHHLVLNVPEPNVFKSQMALSDRRRCLNFAHKSFTGHRVVKSSTGGDGYHPATMVDSLELWNLDALLLDIEGFEYFALKGAQNSIREFRPIILIEVSNKSSAEYYAIKHGASDRLIIELGYKLVAEVQNDHIYVPKEMKWKTD